MTEEISNNIIEKARELILTSGNGFHCKVVNYFTERNWSVLVSPYYNDNVTDESREIDLIAEKTFIIKDNCGVKVGKIKIRLFIECKYINDDVVLFWFHEKDQDKAHNLVSATLQTSDRTIDNKEKHHYLKEEHAAKLFANTSKKKQRNELFYKALNQSLHAMIYYRQRLPYFDSDKLRLWHYPVIVCNSFEKLYKVDFDPETTPTKIDDHFQLEVNYAYLDTNKKHREEYFLIDIVDFNNIANFLHLLNGDVDIMKCAWSPQ